MKKFPIVLMLAIVAVCTVPFGSGVAKAAGDTTAPELRSFSLSPATVDTSTASRTIVVTARITDAGTGAGAMGGNFARFTSPSGQFVDASFDEFARTSGSAQDGTYKATITVPKGSEQGDWTLTWMILSDMVGNHRDISAEELHAAGFPSRFTQSGAGDTTAPELRSFSLSPATVDTSTASRTIVVTARITDAGTGAGAMGGNFARFTSPSGQFVDASFDAEHRTSGSAQDGTYKATITVPQNSEQGDWTVSWMILSDLVGNHRDISAEQLQTAGFRDRFTQSGAGDTTAPELQSFSLSAPRIDTSTASKTIVVTARITDAGTGAGAMGGNFARFTSPSGQFVDASFDEFARTSGSAQDGTYKATITVPQNSEQGDWTVSWMILSDLVGNHRDISAEQLQTAGFPDHFTNTGGGDTSAPQTTIDSGPSGTTSDTSATFGFSSEAGASFECRMDAGRWAVCASPKSFSGLWEGEHTFEVRAIDTAGNTEATPAARTFTVDTTAPESTLDNGPSGATNDSSPSFEFSAEAGASFECRMDGEAWADCVSPKTFSALADGQHTFEVRATDTAGNTEATPPARRFTLDATPSQTTIDSGPTGTSAVNLPSFEFSAEAGARFECRMDGEAWADCVSPKSFRALADGQHTFEVRATDTAGNTEATPAARTFTVDTTPPQTTINGGPAGSTSDTSPAFGFASEEAGASFECRMDTGTWTSCASPKSFSGLADDQHTFQVRAIDAAGNTDATPASRTFTVDMTAPQTTINIGPWSLTRDSSPEFGFISEAGASFQCRMDGEAWADCASPTSFSGLADGEHTFEVHATDAAGNSEAAPATRTFTVDTSAPQTTIDSGPSGATSDTSPAFGFSSEAGASFRCRMDAGAWTSCASPKQHNGLANGQHTFEVRAADAAGNTDATPASRTFTVDTTAPQTTINSGPSGTTRDTSPVFGFSSDASASFQCRMDGEAWAGCASPKSYNGLTEGEHTFEVRAIDAVGNADATPAARAFTVDTTAPQTTIDSGPSGATSDASPLFGFSAQAGASFQCRMDGEAWAGCASPKSFSGLIDGEHTLEVRATDAAGNTEATPATRTFTVDTTAPQTTIESGPTGTSAVRSPVFGFSSEAGASFQCRMDGGAWAGCTSPKSYDGLANGEHTFEVRATDTIGKTDATPATRTFTIITSAATPNTPTRPSEPASQTATNPQQPAPTTPPAAELGQPILRNTIGYLGAALRRIPSVSPVRPQLRLGRVGDRQLPNGGTIAIRITAPRSHLATAASSRQPVTLGSARVTVAKNQTKQITVKLNARARRALRTHSRLIATATLVVTDAGSGARQTTRKTVVLKRRNR